MVLDEAEEALAKLNDEIYGVMSKWIAEGNSPHAIGAALMISALRLYRTTLSDDDYNQFVDFMSDSRDHVQKFDLEGAAKKLN